MMHHKEGDPKCLRNAAEVVVWIGKSRTGVTQQVAGADFAVVTVLAYARTRADPLAYGSLRKTAQLIVINQ